MKKLCLLGAFLFSIFAAQTGFSNCGGPACGGQPSFGGGDQGCGCEQPTGECICKYVTYQACPYTIPRCVEEQVPYCRKCCRWVPQYYQVQKCRYVPEYYSVTCCRQVPEYYDVQECRTVRRVVCEPACRYIPRYYWKRECQPCQQSCQPSCCQ